MRDKIYILQLLSILKMRDALIVGIDPGTTSAYALLDLYGNLIKLKSSKLLNLSTIIEEITNEGKVIIVGCDVSHVPDFVSKLAAKLNAVVVKPDFDFKVGLKQRMTKEFKVKDDHQRDALAAALNAFSEFKETFEKIDQDLKEIGKEHLSSKIKEICIKNKLNIIDAIKLIETPESKPNNKKKRNRFFNYNETTETIKLLKKQNNYLQKKLKYLEFKHREITKQIDKKVEERIKKLNTIADLNNSSYRKEILNKTMEIETLKTKINKLKNCLLNLKENIIVKKFSNLHIDELNNNITYIENPNIYSEKALILCLGKIIIFKEKPSDYLLKKEIIFVNNTCVLEEFEDFVVVDNKKLNKEINSLNLIENLIENYRLERQKQASESILK